MQRVLVVDDEENIRHLLLVTLKKAGFEPTAAPGAREALRLLEDHSFGVIISDVRMPGMDGRELLAATQELADPPYVIMMSAYGGGDMALECVKEGAYDYFNKPFRPDEVVLLLRKVTEREQLRTENKRLRAELDERLGFGEIVGRSEAMSGIFGTVSKIAPYKTTVLLTGESGTGKELLARAIHEHSDRAAGPLVPVNCGAIPENLLESELFGHVKGAFTGASRDKAGLFSEAHKGTIFLDEIAELPVSLQVKLLRVLEDEVVRPVGATESSKVDVRVIAATSRDLDERVRASTFREDLYYRLNVMRIRIPPLRERTEDLTALVEHFVARFNERFGRGVTNLEPDAMEAVLAYAWPGNVRELENAIERAMILSDGDKLPLDVFPPVVQEASLVAVVSVRDDGDLSVKRRVASLEAELIRRALERTGGNRTHACRLLEISHRALLYKMKDYGIDVPARRSS
ncbi:MAG: sigma-54-dependent Fis family transcriptional regulator [Deltaproteobacteria bacterium]|nr:sigma-54-dependent Fis family transcriptional regulator [Deltaproteobacteria bacterium]